MSLKVMFPNGFSVKEVAGTEFLNAKRRLQRVKIEAGNWVEAAVVGFVRQTDVSLLSGTASVIVRVAHMVLRDHLDEYKSHLEAWFASVPIAASCEAVHGRLIRSFPRPAWISARTKEILFAGPLPY